MTCIMSIDIPTILQNIVYTVFTDFNEFRIIFLENLRLITFQAYIPGSAKLCLWLTFATMKLMFIKFAGNLLWRLYIVTELYRWNNLSCSGLGNQDWVIFIYEMVAVFFEISFLFHTGSTTKSKSWLPLQPIKGIL